MQQEWPAGILRVALVQDESVAGDIDGNVAAVVRHVESAGAGVRLVMLPEKFLSGYEPELIKADPERYTVNMGDKRLQPIIDVCQKKQLTVVVGAATRESGQFYIASLVIGPQGRVSEYRKQYLFKNERELYQPGNRGCMLEIDGWKLALGVCYDCGFPEHARMAALQGCHAYLVSALFSKGNGYHESRTWLPARAFDNTMYVLLSNHVGATGGWQACGSNAAWGPTGHVLAEADESSSTALLVELDPAVLREAREKNSVLADCRVFGAVGYEELAC